MRTCFIKAAVPVLAAAWLMVGCGGSSKDGPSAAGGFTTPEANAGPDQIVSPGDTASLNGGGSFDPEGDPFTYQWTLSSAPSGSNASVTGATSATASLTTDVAGRYVVDLRVSQTGLGSDNDSVVVIANTTPVADAGMSRGADLGSLVTLDGTESMDADRDGLTYTWTLEAPEGSATSLQDPETAMASFTADVVGIYEASLIVSDDIATSDPDTVTITVGVPNAGPSANAGTDQSVMTGSVVALDGSGSSDPNGDPLNYEWVFASTPSGSGATLLNADTVMPSFTADLEGRYVAELTVSDGDITSAPDRVSVVASRINARPIADAGEDISASVGETVTLDGTGSSDDNGDALTYSWSLVSVPPGGGGGLSDPTSPQPTFVPGGAGTYVFQLVVNDGELLSTPDNVAVSAIAPELQLFVGRSADDGFNRAALPYSATGSRLIPTNAPSVELRRYKLVAVGGDYTVTNVKAVDVNMVVSPRFSGLQEQQVIRSGEEVIFTLNTPPTDGSIAQLVFSFTVAETGDTFQEQIQLQTN
ncbi:MAG: PKD domain-containing protein [Salinisphaeraceae bacterium]